MTARSFASSAHLHRGPATRARRLALGRPRSTPSRLSPISSLRRRVKLAFSGRRADRYGRVLAQVFLEDRGRGEWVQGTLLADGDARAYGLPESFGCARELLAHEAEARRNRLGLWNNGVYRVMSADRPGELMKLRGKYVRVTGNIVSVGRTKGATLPELQQRLAHGFHRSRRQEGSCCQSRVRSLLSMASRIRPSSFADGSSGEMARLIDIAILRNLKCRKGQAIPANVSVQSPKSPSEPVRAPVDSESGTGGAKELRPTSDGRCGTGRGKLMR